MVNTTNNVSIIVAGIAAQAERKIVAYFRANHAVTAHEALPYKPEGRVIQGQFDRMLARGVLREPKPGSYFLDLERQAHLAEATRQRMRWLVLAVTLLIAVGLLFLYRG